MYEFMGYNPEEENNLKLNLVGSEPLTAYNEEFFIPKVEEGQDVLVGQGFGDGSYYIRCDFNSFSEKLNTITPEMLEELFVAVGKLEKQSPSLDENERRMLHACWRATRIAKNLLGAVASEYKRNESFSEYLTRIEGKKGCIKPLSKCINEAVCSEYSLLTKHVLDLLGVESSIVVGAFSGDVDDTLADRHTYILLNEGNYVFDPTHTAQQAEAWPPRVFAPETPLTLESLQDMSTEGKFGNKIKCKDLLTHEECLYGSGAV